MFKTEILGGDANLKTIIFFVLALPLVLMFGAAGFAKMINAGGMAATIAGEFNLSVNFITFIGVIEFLGGLGVLWFRTRAIAALGLVVPMIGAFSLFMANGDYGMTTHVVVLGFLCLLTAWGSRRPFVEFASRGTLTEHAI